MSLPTYESQSAWKEIQKFQPTSLHFDNVDKPEEEWWKCRGHTIHLDRWRLASARVRLIMHHGVGTNGRMMSMLLGKPLRKAGFETVAIDMPNYGMTQVARGSLVSYVDWVNIANDFINFELENDPRPIVLYGLSAGGMLAYHAAALNKRVKGIVAMTFLDQSDQRARDESCLNLFMSRVGVPFAELFSAIPLLASIKIPMALAGKMATLANSPQAMKIFMTDRTSAGNWVSMRFLSTYMNYKPEVIPEEFTVCPLLLTQPAEDRWTPLYLSETFLKKVSKVPVKIVMLENAGHYPLEEPGLEQMSKAIIAFLKEVSEGN